MGYLRKLSNFDYYFFLSIFVFSFGDMVYLNGYYIPAEILRLLSAFLFACLFIRNLPHMRNPNCIPYNLLIFWIVVVTIIMCLSTGRNSVIGNSVTETIANIFLSHQFIPSLIPIAVLMFNYKRLVDIRFFKNLSMIMACAYLLFYPIAFYNMYTYDWNINSKMGTEESYYIFATFSTLGIRFILPPVIMLFWKRFLNKREWTIILLACIGDLLMSIFLARRGQSFMSILYFLSCWLLYFVFDKNSSKILYLLPIFVLLPVLYYLYTLFADGFLLTIIERGLEDSRSTVEESFYKDVTGIDAIIGRGWLGTYYEQVFHDYRREMESGYLALVLRGGWVYLFLYVSVLLFSAYKGLFHSNNMFVKSFAVIILLHIIDLYPWGLPRFSFQYVSIWIGVYICLFEPYRKMTDIDVKCICFSKEKYVTR